MRQGTESPEEGTPGAWRACHAIDADTSWSPLLWSEWADLDHLPASSGQRDSSSTISGREEAEVARRPSGERILDPRRQNRRKDAPLFREKASLDEHAEDVGAKLAQGGVLQFFKFLVPEGLGSDETVAADALESALFG